MLADVVAAVRAVAHAEITPRYLRAAATRKYDGSLVSEADPAAQQALTARLRAILDVPVLGEEMPAEEQRAVWDRASTELWCVDPIDGTTNFVSGIPYFGVSVALMRERRPHLGVVFNPATDELFAAEHGQGATLNGVALPLRRAKVPLTQAVASVEFKRLARSLTRALIEERPYYSQRNYGAAALDWCYVAAGRFDLYLHASHLLWDCAAGSVILDEAGGRAGTFAAEAFWDDPEWARPVIAALDPDLYVQWREWLRARVGA
ncbi:MAG: inositol monophosphatase family protein [Betaproteobacteria bacterium]|nr:inositol monophosphatase family protein [Betaproteobacteria bacterium]